jgi:ABC-2 type transport system ATP-binding protein
VGGERVVVRMADASELARVVELLAPLSCGEELTDEAAASVEVPVRTADGIVPEVVRMLDAAGLHVRDVGVRRVTLDDVFLTLTGRAAEDEAAEREREAAS